MPRDDSRPLEDSHGKNTLEAVVDTVAQAARAASEAPSEGSQRKEPSLGKDTPRQEPGQRSGWILLGRADSPYNKGLAEAEEKLVQTWQQGVGTAADLVEAASHAAAKQAAQAADTLQSSSQQLQDAAQSRTGGLQDAVTQSFEAAAGRLGAIIPQEGEDSSAEPEASGRRPSSSPRPQENTHAKNSLESAADTVASGISAGARAAAAAAAKSHEEAVRQRRQMQRLQRPGYVLLGGPDSPYDSKLEADEDASRRAASPARDAELKASHASEQHRDALAQQHVSDASSRAAEGALQAASGVQESAADAVASAASRLGALVPQDDEHDASSSPAPSRHQAQAPARHSRNLDDWADSMWLRCKRGVWTYLYGHPEYPQSQPALQEHARDYASGNIPSNTQDLMNKERHNLDTR